MSNFNLTHLVQVSEPDPLAGCLPGWPFSNDEVEPQLAVDPTNPRHFVGVWNQDGIGIVAGVSFNGGNSWQEVVIPGIGVCTGGIWAANGDPWVSFAPNGDVYVSAIGFNLNVPGDAVLVNKSTDGGLTWSAPTTFLSDQQDTYDKDSITADPTNPQLAYISWWRETGSGVFNGPSMFSRTTDGGQTWEAAREIFDPGPHNIDQGHQIVVLPDGTLVNFFSQLLFKNKNGGIIHYDLKLSSIRSLDHGQTWTSAPIHVADVMLLGDTDTDPGIRGVPNPDGGPGVRALFFVPDYAVDPISGNLYAVWQDARFSNFQYSSIAFSMSTDGGFTWSTPIRINQTPDNVPVGDRQAIIPSVAVAADGTVAVTYYDFRNNTSAPGLLTDYWMVHAHANTDLTNPVNWVSENRLTTNSSFDMTHALDIGDGSFVGDYMGLSAAGNNFAALWAMPHQNADGTIDNDSIFFREAMPGESHAELQAVDDHFRSETTAIPDGATLDTRFASMVKSVESASTRVIAANVDRLFAAVDEAGHTIAFGKSKSARARLANAMETDALRLEPSQWMGIAGKEELTAKL
jgi:hypothetical protein